MAILAYQVTGFAYQGSGLFAYQGSEDTVTPTVTTQRVSGVKKRKPIVRRADFSTQEAYELALKAALAGANIAYLERGEEPPPLVKQPQKFKVSRETKPDTVIKVSAADLLALQNAAEMDEMELLQVFIQAIESDYDT